MRMWMIDPSRLCRNHLLGEHGELHKFRHTFVKKYSIKRRIAPVVQIAPAKMKIRHDELAAEMIHRGYKHNSPYDLPYLSYLSDIELNAKVNENNSYTELYYRCSECKKRIDDIIHRFIVLH